MRLGAPYLAAGGLVMLHRLTAHNLSRPHTALGGRSPFQRLNNLLGNDT